MMTGSSRGILFLPMQFIRRKGKGELYHVPFDDGAHGEPPFCGARLRDPHSLRGICLGGTSHLFFIPSHASSLLGGEGQAIPLLPLVAEIMGPSFGGASPPSSPFVTMDLSGGASHLFNTLPMHPFH
jgi:hypothetical protein